jgi:hypothetical protein
VLDRPPQASALRERHPAGDIQLLDHVQELEAVAFAGRGDTLTLLGGRDEPFAVAVADA